MLVGTSVVSAVATVAGNIWRERQTQRREERGRAWLAEDRKAALQEIVARAEAEAEALRIKTEGAAEVLRIETQTAAERLVRVTKKAAIQLREDQRKSADLIFTKLEEGQVATATALEAANGTVSKIADLNQQLLMVAEKVVDESLLRSGNTKKLDEMKETVTRLDERTP